MAFTLYAHVGSTSQCLSDGSPFSFESIENLSGSNIVRFQQRSPYQNGVSDLGYRLGARVVTINLLFYATTDALLDTYRQTLTNVFRPLSDIAIRLQVTRDDNSVRYLTCYTVDDIAIDLVPEHRPGHLHRATLKLRAANPLWTDETVRTTTGTVDNSQWWLAGGAIDAIDVLEHVDNPAIGQAWSWAGTATDAWTVVVRTVVPGSASTAGTRTAWKNGSVGFFWDGSKYVVDTGSPFQLTELPTGTATMFFAQVNSTQANVYFDSSNDETYSASPGVAYRTIRGTAGIWGSASTGGTAVKWPNPIVRAAIINYSMWGEVALPYRVALDRSMSNEGISVTFNVVNQGDVPEYPNIALTGPMANPVIVNNSTGDTLDLTGLSIGSADTYYVKLQSSDKIIVDGTGNSVLGSVTTLPIAMASWYLAPNPVAAGGTNSITVTADSSAGSANVIFTHYNRYVSF